MKVIRQMAGRGEAGKKLSDFQRRHQNEESNRTLEFKGGSFKSAYYAKCPIVPAVLIDSYKAFDVSSIKPLTVQLHYLAPLYYDDYKDMKTNEVAALVKQRIDAVISEKRVLAYKMKRIPLAGYFLLNKNSWHNRRCYGIMIYCQC